MILKNADDKSILLTELAKLTEAAPAPIKPKIDQEARLIRAGLKGEQESAYLIDFDYGKSQYWVVIHDLRLEIGGRVAQIDHLIINRLLDVLVLETKHFHAGLKITDEGEFLRWNDYKKTFDGMASPLAQNERHIQVLKDAFGQINLPTRLGIRLTPTFHSYILVSPNARIDRPRKFDTSNIVKADTLRATWQKDIDNVSALGAFSGLAKLVAKETVIEIGQQLVALHQAKTTDYSAKFGLDQQRQAPAEGTPLTQTSARPAPASADKPKCRACGSENLTIQYGKYGYYFKCSACGGNTPTKISCGTAGHKERLRKEGNNFYRECADCKTSSLYFQNPA